MDRFQADSVIRALAGGGFPKDGDTIIFTVSEQTGQPGGWRFASPLEPLATELGLTVDELTESIRTLLGL